MQKSIEASVLGAALSEPGLWLAFSDRIKPDLFASYRLLADALLEMTAAGHPTDPKTAFAWLAEHGIKYGLADLLALADQAAISKESMARAVDALHEISKRDAARQLLSRLTRELDEPNNRVDSVLAAGIAGLTEIGASSTTGPRPLSEILQSVAQRMGKPQPGGVKTGIPKVDAVTGGLKPGEMIVLGARPSMGKTSLALNIVTRAAQAGKTVVVFSLEMSGEQVCQRILSDLSKVNLARIVTHRLSGNDYTALTNAANIAHRFGVFVGENADNAEPVCRQIKHTHGLDLVVIDYLQLMSTKAESRQQEISKLSRRCKMLARSLGVPVLVLSQLNRAVEQRACKRPQLADLRESGSLEQDADIVKLLWRPAYYDSEADPTLAELIVAKHRNGPTGMVELHWLESCARFGERKAE
jgi:replicative DNA helicase